MSGGRGGSSKADLQQVESWLRTLSLKKLVEMVDELDAEDLAFLEEGIQTNLRLAEHGLKFGSGLGVGKALERLVRQKLIQQRHGGGRQDPHLGGLGCPDGGGLAAGDELGRQREPRADGHAADLGGQRLSRVPSTGRCSRRSA
ncbi:MAG: hypothetical protein MZV70_10475 [Desulfobacterales bacterium]|nr:hypothetical protein [Desulfobacterales bacterium]